MASAPPPSVVSLAQIGTAAIGSSHPQSVELTGTATYDSNSPERATAPVSLVVSADGTTELKIEAAAGDITDVWAPAGVTGTCASSLDSKGKPAIPASNCWNPASWVLPTIALADSTVLHRLTATISKTTADSSPELSVRVQIATVGRSANAAKYISAVSSRTILLDPSTLLPVSMKYSEHPGDRIDIAVPIEITYSNYRDVNGAAVPFRITGRRAGHVALDITVEHAVVK